MQGSRLICTDWLEVLLPFRGQALGSSAAKTTFQQPGVPTEFALNGVAGHVLVLMFELHDSSPPGTHVGRQVRCSLEGKPVIETTFRLHFN